MKHILHALPVLAAAVILITAAPAQAHGGVELVLLAGLIGIVLFGLACIIGVIVTYFVIYRASRHFSRKSGKPPTSKISIAILSPIAFIFVALTGARIAQHFVFPANHMPYTAEHPQSYPLDPEQEAKLVEKAKRDIYVSEDLGNMYLNGHGVVQDFEKAYFWPAIYTQTVSPDDPRREVTVAALESCKHRITMEQAAAVDARVAEWLKENKH